MATVASLVIDLQADTTRLRKGLDQANRNTKKWAQQSKKRAQGVDNAFKNLRRTVVALGGVFAAKRLFGNAITESADLEEAVISLGRVTDRSLKDIQEQIAGLDPILGTATELTKGFYQVLSAGVRDPLKSVELLTVASQAAKVAQIEQSEVIKGLTKIMAGFEGEVKNAAEAADLLFTIEREGQTTVAELVPVIGSLAKVSKDLGVESKELGAALAQITQTAGSTEEAAVQLQGVFLGLLKPTVDMKRTIKELGFESTEAAIAQLGFAETLKRLKDSTQGSAEQMAKLFSNVRGLKGLSALASQDFQKLNEKIVAMSTGVGSAQRAFDDWRESTNALTTTIKSQLNAELVDLGQSILPLVNEQLNDVSDWLKNNRDEMKRAFDGAARGAKIFLNNLDLVVQAAKIFISLKLAFFLGALAQKALLAAVAFRTLGAAITATNAIAIIIVGTFTAIQGALFLANKELDKMDETFRNLSFKTVDDATKSFDNVNKEIEGVITELDALNDELEAMEEKNKTFSFFRLFLGGDGKVKKVREEVQKLEAELKDLGDTANLQKGLIKGLVDRDALIEEGIALGVFLTGTLEQIEAFDRAMEEREKDKGKKGKKKELKDFEKDFLIFDPEIDIARGIADMIEMENETIRTGLEKQETMRQESADRQLAGLNAFFVASQQEQLAFEQWEIQQLTETEAAKQRVRDLAMSTVLGSFAVLFQQLGQQNEAAFVAFKAIAIAQVSIDTVLAVQKALAQGGPFLGPALAAAAAATGAANVAQILSTQPGGTATPDTGESVGTPGTGTATLEGIQDATTEPAIREIKIIINVQGSVTSEQELARILIPKLEQAFSDGVR
jgi:TP901 family phage tail tape measure protein